MARLRTARSRSSHPPNLYLRGVSRELPWEFMEDQGKHGALRLFVLALVSRALARVDLHRKVTAFRCQAGGRFGGAPAAL
jgi:hypothetical protein